MDQRRLLLAVAICVLFLMVYQELVSRLYPRPQPSGPVGKPEAAAPPKPDTPHTPPPASGLAAPAAGGASPVEVATDVLHAAVTPLGARLSALKLNQYRRTVGTESEPLDLVADGPLLPLTLQLGSTESDAAVRYECVPARLVLHGLERGEIVCRGATPQGLSVEKRYSFVGNDYLFELGVNLGAGSPTRVIGVVVSAMPSERPTGRAPGEVGLALSGTQVVQKGIADLEKQPVSVDAAAWVGFAAQYFLVAVAPEQGAARGLLTSVDGTPIARLDAPLSNGGGQVAVYAGPKDRDDLVRAGHHFDRSLDFGWFWFIAIPLLRALQLLHRVTGNYGIAIILLTTIIKIATIPLTQTTFRNMREMQKLQPQITKLRERLKDDQLALQKEMMDLYKRHRVNPLSGCLPMLLQAPIFIGLYNALGHAIELRHAPFALWIHDLSAPERLPVFGVGLPVLTLLMGGTMLLQQWMTPQQGDPTQQRMMMLMPVVFTVMFMNFPAGLSLYWLVNNILSVGHQYWMLRSEA